MNFAERDTKVVWHPYTQMKTAGLPIVIVKGKGVYLWDDRGKQYIDGISSWWVNLHGHSHPYICEKIMEQLDVLEHVLFAGFTHPKAVEFAERLLEILPEKHQKIFFSDNGSTAIEVALKIVFQYWHNQGVSEKNTFVAFKGGYHGDTFGAMSVGGREFFSKPFVPWLFDTVLIDVPTPGKEKSALAQLEKAISKGNVAGFIFEPLLQGAAGMVMYPPEGLDALLECCREHQVPAIADEVATGFGRTGRLFAVDHLSEKPDIICMSKGLTGGAVPMGATSCAQYLYDAFLAEDKSKMLLHGHSYAGNPVGCAAGLASLDLLLKGSCQENIQRIIRQHRHFLAYIQDHPVLADGRMLGTVLALEVKSADARDYTSYLRDVLYHYFIERQILLRPLGNVVYIIPPYCIQPAELERIYRAVHSWLDLGLKTSATI